MRVCLSVVDLQHCLCCSIRLCIDIKDDSILYNGTIAVIFFSSLAFSTYACHSIEFARTNNIV
jgi:hypothetical protein